MHQDGATFGGSLTNLVSEELSIPTVVDKLIQEIEGRGECLLWLYMHILIHAYVHARTHTHTQCVQARSQDFSWEGGGGVRTSRTGTN